jgi:uncharacterized protein
MKQTAAISALFIFVNSMAGLAGQLTKGIQFSTDMYGFVAVAFLGGLAGAYFGALRFKHIVLKYLLAIVLGIASYKLLFTNLKKTDKKTAGRSLSNHGPVFEQSGAG